MKSMHTGDERPLRIRAVTETAVIAEPIEEELFNPEAAKTDGNPFPNELQETNYNSMTVDELKALLRARGLEVTGKKAELIARLIEADTPSEEAVKADEVVPSEEAATSEEKVSDEDDQNNSGLDEPVGE